MSEWITPKVTIPQRNLSQELDAIEAANNKYAAPDYARAAQYSPLYNQLGVQNLSQQVQGYVDANGNYVPGTLALGQQATETQRQQDVADVTNLGPSSTAATLGANPFLARSLAMLGAAETPDALLSSLNSQAQGALAAGGALSPQDERDIREASRGAFADKGLQNTDQSAIAELFNRDAATRSRALAGQQFATGVEGLNSTMRDFLGRATQIDATALSDPWSTLIGRAPGAAPGLSLTPIGSNTTAFDPYNAYAQDLFSSNQNAAATQAIGNAQNQAATRAAIASIAGGAIKASDIRLKQSIREIGVSPSGIPIYEFEYRAGCVPKGLRPVRYVGVMADEVAGIKPGAVSVDRATGFLQVDYSMIDVEFKEAA